MEEKIILDFNEIKSENTFAGYFYVLVKVGESLLQQIDSESLADLVKSLKQVKKNYIERIHNEL
jgi:hypothetical protein